MVLVHLQPVVIVIVCHALATDGGVGGVLAGHPAWLVLWIVFDLDTPISLLLVICLPCFVCFVFAVSVVGCLLGYSSCLVVWIPLFLDPSDGVFGRFDLAALCGCRTLNFCLFCLFLIMGSVLPGYMFRYQYCLVGGLEAIVLGSIRWCVWSFRPSSPLRLPHLKFLFVCLLLTKAERGTQPVADSAQKSADRSEDNAATGGTTAARNKSLASTIVGCSHMNKQCASSSTTVEQQQQQRLRLHHGPSKGAPVRSQPRLHGQKYWNLVHQK